MTSAAPPVKQPEIPFAKVHGQPWTRLPDDLYIPPEALEVFLEAFEGPLDLLLYLIRRQNLDILDIPVAEVTRQYTEYIELMQDLKLELAAEYLVMAAILAEIKSRMLLPRPEIGGEDESDPRAELIRRLQEYERYKQAAEDLDTLPRSGRDFAPLVIPLDDRRAVRQPPTVELRELVLAFAQVMRRAELHAHHQVQREALSVRERMTRVLALLKGRESVAFEELFNAEEGRMGAVVSFMALLELLRERLIDVVQREFLGRIYLRAAQGTLAAESS